MEYFRKLRQLLTRKNKQHLLLLVLFSVFVSVVETVGISAIMPFIDVATNFDNIQTNDYYRAVYDFFGFESAVNFAIAFGLVLLGFYVFRGVVNFLFGYFMARYSQGLYAQISHRLFATYLMMPYQHFAVQNSSFLTKTITTEGNLLAVVISQTLLMLSEIFVVIFLYGLMLFASWKITLVFTVILLLKLLFLTQMVSKKLKRVGKERADFNGRIYELLNRTLGNFKQIKLQSIQRIESLKSQFNQVVTKYSRAGVVNSTLSQFPRLFLETMGFGLVVLMLIYVLFKQQSNVLNILPTLSLFVLALYRLLPSVNRIMTGYNSLMYHHKAIDIIDDGLKTAQENTGNQPVIFNQHIILQSVSFGYDKQPVLTDINLTINKGDKVAFVGESGVGKSTLVDLIIGLYQPNSGEILIDDVPLSRENLQNWRAQIGYIPQHIYLFDGTVADNICFGREHDDSLLEKVTKQANIYDFLKTKQGLDTLVGEGGVQLSGGQKQRIAIARALYGQPEILVLDEATSALDSQIEQAIMEEIYQISENKTLIIIAHRVSTIEGCDRVYTMKQGELLN